MKPRTFQSIELEEKRRKELTHLYAAHIYIPTDISEQATAKCQPIEIEQYNEFFHEFRMTAPYFTSKDVSTYRLHVSDLNEELKISKELIVFYSEDEERCSDWLHGKYMALFEEAKARYEQLASIVIQDQTLDETKEAPLTR